MIGTIWFLYYTSVVFYCLLTLVSWGWIALVVKTLISEYRTLKANPTYPRHYLRASVYLIATIYGVILVHGLLLYTIHLRSIP